VRALTPEERAAVRATLEAPEGGAVLEVPCGGPAAAPPPGKPPAAAAAAPAVKVAAAAAAAAPRDEPQAGGGAAAAAALRRGAEATLRVAARPVVLCGSAWSLLFGMSTQVYNYWLPFITSSLLDSGLAGGGGGKAPDGGAARREAAVLLTAVPFAAAAAAQVRLGARGPAASRRRPWPAHMPGDPHRPLPPLSPLP
jgi:hypothetical protein